MFIVVSFKDGMEAIPESWYIPKRKAAYFPPGKVSQINWRNMVQSCIPPEKNWKLHEVDRVWCQSDTYGKAIQRLQHFLKFSESESSGVDRSRKRKRSMMENKQSTFRKGGGIDNKFHKTYRADISDDSSDEGLFNLESFPQLPNEDHLSEELKEQEFEEVENGFMNQDETGHIEVRDTRYSLSPKRVDSEDNLPGSESLAKNEMSNKDFQRIVLKKLNRILFEHKKINEQHLDLMRQFSMTSQGAEAATRTDEEMRQRLPLKTCEELEEICRSIADENEMAKLVKVLKLCGGSDVKQASKLVLKKLLVDELASKYSFQGRRLKPAFNHFLVNEAIRRSIRTRFAEATDAEIDKRIEDYLRYATQREKRDAKGVPVVPVAVDLFPEERCPTLPDELIST